MTITAEMIKELREKTSVGIMDCKVALKEAGGDLEKAVVILREKGLAMANKKADRSATEGRVFIQTESGTVLALILNCETDFVGNNEQFIALGNQIVAAAAKNAAKDIETLEQVKINGQTVSTLLSESVLKLGENISLGTLFSLSVSGSAEYYIHSNGKMAAIVTSSGANDSEILKDIAMHIVAASPTYLNREEVPASVIEAEASIVRKQMETSKKPAQVMDKIIEGKVTKFYQENCLLEQSFIKDPEKVISQLLPSGSTIQAFKRFVIES